MEFEQIYNAYFKSVYRYIWKFSGDEHIAEEMTSETFLRVMKSIGNFRGDCDMRVWICQIAKNTYYSYLKKNRRTASIDETEWQNITDPKAFLSKERFGMEGIMKKECSVVQDVLPLYLENMVSEATKVFVEEHLEDCADCAAELERLQSGRQMTIFRCQQKQIANIAILS